MGRWQGGSKSVATVSLLNPRQFEMAVSDGLRRRGVNMSLYGGAAGSGVDLVAARDGLRHLVRCEPWRAQSIGEEVIHELCSAVNREGARGGHVVSSGRFSRQARAAACANNIELFDEHNIGELVNPD